MILADVFRPRASAEVTWTPLDSRWYTNDLGMTSDSGIGLSADTVFRCGTVLAAVRFLASSWAMCPPSVIRKMPGKRVSLPDHYAQIVLRDPNAWQTGFRWRAQNMIWASMWGNSFNRIEGGASAFVEHLKPIHPTRCRVVDQRSDGSLLYQHTPVSGRAETIGQEELLHFRGFSLDGFAGAPMYQLIRNAVGIALVAERHAATSLKKGARVAGLLVPTGPTTKEQRTALRDTWLEAYGGPEQTGTVATLPFGVDFKPIASDNIKAQFLELRDFQVGEILRFLGVPGVVVGYADKTATYASAKEFFESGGIKHCVLPWLMNFEAEEEKALLPRGAGLQIRHNLDVLLRANTKDRYEAIYKATGRPWMTGNEAREIEDLDEDSDPSMNKVLMPTAMATTAPTEEEPAGPSPAPKHPKPAAPPADDDGDDSAVAKPSVRRADHVSLLSIARGLRPIAAPAADAVQLRAVQFAVDAAARVVRREVAAIRGGRNGGQSPALRLAGDPAAWRAWCADFYRQHAVHVAEALHLDPATAGAYCTQQRDALIAGGVAVTETWEADRVPELAVLALGEE